MKLSLLKRPAPRITFTCRPEDESVIAPPVRAKTVLPEWFRKLPAVTEDKVSPTDSGLTVKRCMPVLDAMMAGWVVGLPVLGAISQTLTDSARSLRKRRMKQFYMASAAPPVRYPNVYGIDMPSAHELIAHNRSTQDVADLIGADWLIYQDLPDLIEAVGGGKIKIEQFDCAVFDGKYVTGDVDEAYLNKIEQARNDASKVKSQAVSAIIDLYNN